MVSYIFVTDWLQIQSHKMRRDVFQAIADPTRRAIINMISHQSLNLNAVAESFDISRPAISKHIKILTQCGLITIKQRGRERYCEAKLQKLDEVSQWVEQYRVFWTDKLNALENFLAQDTDISKNKIKSIKKTKGK
ncbi:MAG: winged helix-turn-helix transcriptional regulator [Mucilaginibacter sp.]|nr:winged helix-turn-helix transcriptional regulator [Mucilaginibacter sp.]